jgi:phosphoserine phosphatase RsbU/P
VPPTTHDSPSPPDDHRVADLLAVLDVSRLLAATAELQPLLEVIERAALEVLGCERASVFLHDPATGDLYSRVATGGHQVRFPASRGIAGEAFRTGALINVADAYADPRFNPDVDKATGYRTRSILTCPLRGWDGRVPGVIQVLNKHSGPFGAWDEALVGAFATQAGVAVQRQLLLEEVERKKRIERDLNIAREIQRGLLPRRPPRVPGFEVAGWSQPADKTGGDIFDFKELGDGGLAVTVADASGHGIGPALVVAQYRALVRSALVQSGEPDRVAAVVNALLSEDLPGDMFVTAFFGLLRPAEHRLTYLSAGHGPILSYRAAAGEFRILSSHGPMLNFDPEQPYDAPDAFDFAPGDLFLILTDGFHEWPGPDGDNFGLARLEELVRQHHALPPAELIRRIHEGVLAFARDTPQPDDLTAVVIKRCEAVPSNKP